MCEGFLKTVGKKLTWSVLEGRSDSGPRNHQQLSREIIYASQYMREVLHTRREGDGRMIDETMMDEELIIRILPKNIISYALHRRSIKLCLEEEKRYKTFSWTDKTTL